MAESKSELEESDSKTEEVLETPNQYVFLFMYIQVLWDINLCLKSKKILLSVNIKLFSDNKASFHNLIGSTFSFLKVHEIVVLLPIGGITDWI